MDFQSMAAFAVLGVAVMVEGAAGLIWAIRQEGRLNGHDVTFEEREKRADERHKEVLDRLERFENKIDNLRK